MRAEVIQSSFIISWNDCAANWGPQSEIILSGSPNCLYKLSSKSCAAPLVVNVFVQGIKITPFERPWSTTTKMESKLLTGGRSMIKSIEQLAKGLITFADLMGIRAGCDGDPLILNC